MSVGHSSVLQEKIRHYAEAKAFRLQTLERWLAWEEADQAALFRLVEALKVGENHLRDLMDWLEEIALRDRVRIHEILERSAVLDRQSDPRLGRADRLKRVKEELRRLRFPRLAQLEDAIAMRVRELKLYPQIKVAPAPGLEGGRLQLVFSVSNADELKSAIDKLAHAAETQSLREIFALLSGQELVRSD
jgi:hypothetical protein